MADIEVQYDNYDDKVRQLMEARHKMYIEQQIDALYSLWQTADREGIKPLNGRTRDDAKLAIYRMLED